MTESHDVARLLGRGGWELVDPQPSHRANPERFWLPSAEQLGQLHRGSSVRAIFNVLDQADIARDNYAPYAADGSTQLATMRERMWSFVESVDGDTLHCILMNRPYASHTDLCDGVRFKLPKDHVIDLEIDPEGSLDRMLKYVAPIENATSPVDRDREPRISPAQLAVCKRAKVKPQRPSLSSLMLVSKNLDDASEPIHGGRMPPRHERDDVGWAVYGGPDDMEVTRKKHGFSIIRVHEISARNRRVSDYLALPPGWAFVLGKNDYEDIYPID